jgi:Flp pilus assembly protein TadD
LNALLRGNRAYLLAETGRTPEAVREIDAAVALESANANVIFYSAVIHEMSGDRERALQDLLAAAQRGYTRTVIDRHPDLMELRKDPGYRKVMDVSGQASR